MDELERLLEMALAKKEAMGDIEKKLEEKRAELGELEKQKKALEEFDDRVREIFSLS